MFKVTRLLLVGCAVAPLCAAAFSPFQAGTGGWQLAAPVVGNIDGDAALEIVIATRSSNGQWVVDAYDYSGARIAGFPHNAGSKPVNATPTLVDLEGDSRNEIVFTRGNDIVALRGNGTTLWTHSVTPLNYIPDGGFHALTNGFFLSGLPIFQPTLPLTAEFYSEVSPPLIADLDGDGTKEVVTGWKIDPDKIGLLQDYNPYINDYFGAGEWGITGEEWSGGVLINDARTGEQKFVYHFHQLVEAGLALAQLDSDRALEVLVLNDADGVVAFDATQPHGVFGAGMLHKQFGKNLRLLSGSYHTGVDVEVADLDGDGLHEVLVPTTQIDPNWQPSETILDDDGTILWREWKQEVQVQNAHGWFNSAVLVPVNPDNDNRIDVLGFTHAGELTFRTWDGVKLAPRTGWPKTFAPSLPTPPVVGDVDGDGQQEIVVATYNPGANPSTGKLYVYALNGTQEAVVDIPSGVKHIPTLTDVDANGTLEVICRALDGKVHIRSFGNGSPARVSWATHRGNAQHDGNYNRSLYPTGTPLVTSRTAGPKKLTLSWRLPSGSTATGYLIYRADKPEGPFVQVGSLPGSATTFSDTSVETGKLYVYELAAQYSSGIVRSAPIALTADFNSNLVVNGGFEADDDRGWDKWFSGDVPWQNMTGSTVSPRSGARSMEIKLQNHGNNSTITQYSHYGVPEDYLPVTPGGLYSYGGFIRTSALNADTRQWFEWDSSRTGENTNARPNLPWPDYFTPSLKTSGGTASDWTYLNRVLTVPAGFPNVQLRHRYTTTAPVTGSVFIDDIFFRQLPAPNDPKWIEFIPFKSRWRYLAAAAPANWFAANFSDASWTEAPAKFGNGGGPQNIATVVPKNLPNYHFRKTFVVSAGNYEELLLAATCTDDYGGTVYPLRIWLNATELKTGGIEAVTGEGNIVKYYDLAPFLHLIRPGTNTIAVQLSNIWQPTWDNVAFDISLKAIAATPAPISNTARINSINRSPAGAITLQVSADGASQWLVQSSDTSRPFNWALVQAVTFGAPGTQTVADTGQNGRVPPAQARTRFYRMVKGT